MKFYIRSYWGALDFRRDTIRKIDAIWVSQSNTNRTTVIGKHAHDRESTCKQTSDFFIRDMFPSLSFFTSSLDVGLEEGGGV